MRQDGNLVYSYGFAERLFTYGMVLVGCAAAFSFTVVFAVGLVSDLILWISGQTSHLLYFSAAIVTSLLGDCVPLIFANMYPSFTIANEGMRVQTFFFWWISIPWEWVQEIRPTRSSSRSQLVIVEKLTIIHRLVGWVAGRTWRPAFVIKGTLHGYDDAVNIIRSKVC